MAEQGTAEWHLERCGYCTASRFQDVLAKARKAGDESASRRNYRAELVIERLTQQQVDGFSNAATLWGNETEPLAREHIEAETGLIIVRPEFIKHPDIPWVGSSPDGLIGADGGCEIKCPQKSANHIELLRYGPGNEHIAQVQGNMWVTGRKWWLLCSFDPRMPDHLKLHFRKIQRDDAYIETLQREVVRFLAEVEEDYEFLKGLGH